MKKPITYSPRGYPFSSPAFSVRIVEGGQEKYKILTSDGKSVFATVDAHIYGYLKAEGIINESPTHD